MAPQQSAPPVRADKSTKNDSRTERNRGFRKTTFLQAMADRMANEIMRMSLDSLLPQTRQLLVLIENQVKQKMKQEKKTRSQVRFTQQQLRESFGWRSYQLRRRLPRLVDLEFVVVHQTDHALEYELLYNGEDRANRLSYTA